MSPIGITPARHSPPNLKPPKRTAALAAVAAATALTLSACVEPATGTLNTRAGYTIDGADIPVSICPEGDDSRLAEEEGLLLGAHFALRVECVASFTELPESFQLEYLFGEDPNLFPPENGYEFTMVQFAPDPGHEGLDMDDAPTELEAVLSIGEKEWVFTDEVPAPGSAYLAVAAKDAPISLEVNDAGRTQSLDLRERTAGDLVQGLYHGSRKVVTDYAAHAVDAYLSTGGYEYWVEEWNYSTTFTANRVVYVPEEGWVTELDRVVLSLDFVWLHAGNGLIWEIDPKKTLKVSGDDGELTPTAVDHTSEEWGDGEIRYYTMSYDVPADALQFTLEFSPKGPISWPDEGVEMPVTNEESHTLEVDFS